MPENIGLLNAASKRPKAATAQWFGVRSDDIARWQPLAWPFIKRALQDSNGDYSPSDIFAACRRAEMQLWLVYDEDRIIAAVVTKLIEAPRQNRCLILLCAGDGIMDWLHFLSEIEGWAKQRDCAAIDIYGRHGWERLLPGYEFQHVGLRKRL